MENTSLKRVFVYSNLIIFSLMCWYVAAELLLTLVWRTLYH